MTKTVELRFTAGRQRANYAAQSRTEGIMFELGPEKLLMLLLICLVIFGGKRIPEIGGAIGKGIREFKRGVSDIGESVNQPVEPMRHDLPVPESRDEGGPEPKRLQ